MNIKEVVVDEEIAGGDEIKIIIKIVGWYYKYIIICKIFYRILWDESIF
jgi:hypothetical protein